MKIKDENVMTTSEIGKRLGVYIPGEFIENELGIPPDYKSKNTKAWLEKNFSYICHELSQYFFGVGYDFINRDNKVETN